MESEGDSVLSARRAGVMIAMEERRRKKLEWLEDGGVARPDIVMDLLEEGHQEEEVLEEVNESDDLKHELKDPDGSSSHLDHPRTSSLPDNLPVQSDVLEDRGTGYNFGQKWSYFSGKNAARVSYKNILICNFFDLSLSLKN